MAHKSGEALMPCDLNDMSAKCADAICRIAEIVNPLDAIQTLIVFKASLMLLWRGGEMIEGATQQERAEVWAGSDRIAKKLCALISETICEEEEHETQSDEDDHKEGGKEGSERSA